MSGGLHTFSRRLETIRQANAQRPQPPVLQPVSPATTAHLMNAAASTHPSVAATVTMSPTQALVHQITGLRLNQSVPADGQVRRQPANDMTFARRVPIEFVLQVADDESNSDGHSSDDDEFLPQLNTRDNPIYNSPGDTQQPVAHRALPPPPHRGKAVSDGPITPAIGSAMVCRLFHHAYIQKLTLN